MQWRVISDTALCFHSWNGEFVVYNTLSGDTHLLGSMAAQILLKLQQTPSDVITLAGSLGQLSQTELDDELSLQVEHLLADLDKLALVTRS